MSPISGTEGLTPTDIQNEISRGARFVVYQWCLSLFVVTLKRGSRVHFLKPGETGFLPGFLWTTFSLLFGWWGIPWGPIYTIGSLWTNLRGGIDVTAAVSADLANTHGAPAMPTLPGTRTGGRWSLGPLAAVGLLVAAVFTFVAGGHYYSQQHRPVALANGLSTAYTAEIDGVARTLPPHSVAKIELPAGEHTLVATLPGGLGETRTTFTVEDTAVVNPDGAAVVSLETNIYTPDNAPRAEMPKPLVQAGQPTYSFPESDLFLDEFPGSVRTSQNSGEIRRTRLAVYAEFAYDRNADIVREYAGQKAMVAYLNHLGRRLPADEKLIATAVGKLAPEEARQFFSVHLATRPVIVEWHRAYQNFTAQHSPEAKLVDEYRRLAEAEPDEGAFAYLHGRLLDDPAADTTWFERALTAKRPCLYAHFALAYNDVARGDFAAALTGLDRARAAGLDNGTVRQQRIECLLALGRASEALAQLRAEPGARLDFSRVNTELHLAFLSGGRAEAKRVIDTLLAHLPADTRRSSGPEIRRSLEAQVAYFDGDPKALGDEIGANAQGFPALTRALCRHDLDAAATAAAKLGTPNDLVAAMLLYISAESVHDARADTFWKNLITCWAKDGNRRSRLANHFNGSAPLSATQLLDYPMTSAEKRLFLTALGLHEPKLRAAAFARARQCNFSREFPHHLVAAALAQ